MWGLGKIAAVGIGLFAGGSFLNKLMGGDPDFTQAWMMNRYSGQGGFFKTYFQDGLGSMFMGGSRTMAACYGMGAYGGGLYGNPAMMGMNPYMMNPAMMGCMPYGMGMGPMMWGAGRYF